MDVTVVTLLSLLCPSITPGTFSSRANVTVNWGLGNDKGESPGASHSISGHLSCGIRFIVIKFYKSRNEGTERLVTFSSSQRLLIAQVGRSFSETYTETVILNMSH